MAASSVRWRCRGGCLVAAHVAERKIQREEAHPDPRPVGQYPEAVGKARMMSQKNWMPRPVTTGSNSRRRTTPSRKQTTPLREMKQQLAELIPHSKTKPTPLTPGTPLKVPVNKELEVAWSSFCSAFRGMPADQKVLQLVQRADKVEPSCQPYWGQIRKFYNEGTFLGLWLAADDPLRKCVDAYLDSPWDDEAKRRAEARLLGGSRLRRKSGWNTPSHAGKDLGGSH